MYSQHIGWLHATPEGAKESRLAKLPEESPLREPPDCDNRLTNAFHGIGMCEYTMGGQSPISWTEINAYSIASQNNYDAWEKEAIRKMSENYCSWIHKGKNNNIQSPYNPFIESQDALDKQRDIVSNQWKSMKAARKAQRKEQECAKDKASQGIANGKAGNKTKFKGLNTTS